MEQWCSALLCVFGVLGVSSSLTIKLGLMSSTVGEALNGPSITMALNDFKEKEIRNVTDELDFRKFNIVLSTLPLIAFAEELAQRRFDASSPYKGRNIMPVVFSFKTIPEAYFEHKNNIEVKIMCQWKGKINQKKSLSWRSKQTKSRNELSVEYEQLV
ncbi:hypothetical protein CAPTEDRAFT_204457 [Capitella teleta]|uniref:Uncharacterized protein n=1 Tax=Capitella teleta TaxID=283909 RepID=R7V793_CAPTE|nr:hypothetical protein CAPTEDRAFT_204457 [Capitella teleta]|eukprot:ELU14713.1 hypothetical protein CAPTEDRAFT_204457 [Capitella teleta]